MGGENKRRASAYGDSHGPLEHSSYANDLRSLGRLARASIVSRPERVWRFFLGVAALLELLAYVLPFFFLPQDGEGDNEMPLGRERRFLFFPVKSDRDVIEEEHVEWCTSCWFDDHRYQLGVLFSALWFVHSFVSANAARHWTLRRKDHDALLKEDGWDAKANGDEGQKSKEKSAGESTAPEFDKGDRVKKVEPEGVTMRAYDDMAYLYGGSWGVFVAKALWYLMLLPVGFYMLSLLDFREIFLGDGGDDDTVKATVAGEDLKLEASDDVATFGNRVITKQTRYCLAYASLIYVAQTLSKIAGAAVRTRVVALGKRWAARMAKFAIRNPRRAKRRLKKALTVLRWVKYLLPLIGTGNKLLGNSKDLIKKYHQSRQANQAKRIRQKLWTELDPEERRVQAAVVIQKNFRAHRVQKTESALRLIRMEKRDAAVLRIQGILRKKAAAARVRVLRKQQELRELQMKQLSMKKRRTRMSAEERRRIYQLQDQLGIEFQKSGTGMLLRPNTRFAVTWKVLFVVCVILEISHLAVKPRLAKYKDEATGKPLNVNLVLERMFVPDPMETRAQCLDPSAGKKKKKKSTFEKKGEQVDASAGRDSRYYYGPWYCGEPWRTSSRWFAEAVRFVIQKAIVLVGVICFMDVFVTFFTGELDEETGVLQPKPFFVRWLLPGLVLQLLVNPTMVDVAAAVHKLRRGVHHVGPARVWRWTKAFAVPSFTAFVAWFEWSVWRRFVKKKNAEIVHNALIE